MLLLSFYHPLVLFMLNIFNRVATNLKKILETIWLRILEDPWKVLEFCKGSKGFNIFLLGYYFLCILQPAWANFQLSNSKSNYFYGSPLSQDFLYSYIHVYFNSLCHLIIYQLLIIFNRLPGRLGIWHRNQ